MFETNSPIKEAVMKWQQNGRSDQPGFNFRPVGLGQTSGAGGGNFLPVNQQKSVSTKSSQDAGAQGPKPPSYVPPIQSRDAQGKTLPQYRMGIGHRILGTLVNFANGFAGNHAQPIYVGSGALNNRYYQEEAQRQKQNQENLDWWRTQHLDAKDPVIDKSDPGSGGTQNDSAPAPKAEPRSSLFTPPYSARERFALSRSGALPAPNYRFTAFNPTTNQRIGSHDGRAWSDLPSSESTGA